MADTLTLSAIDRGWYRSDGYRNPTNTNYLVGDPTDLVAEYRNFFVFDLASVTQPISAASLRLWNPSGGYASTGSDSPGFERYTLFDVTTNVTALTSGSGGTSAFQDIGEGVSLGGYAATSADNSAYVTVPLNAAGVAALNAANGLFAVGGAITTLNGDWTDGEMLFGYTGLNSDVTELILTVPEPSTWVIIASGLACMACVIFRRWDTGRCRSASVLALFAAFAMLQFTTAGVAPAGPVSYQYARRSVSGYAQAAGYARLRPEVVREWGGNFSQSISGTSGVPGNFSAFAVSVDSTIPNDGSPVTATANWSSDWSLAPSTFGESGGGVLHRVDFSVATTTDFTITGSITNGSVYLWTGGYQNVFPSIDAGANVTRTVDVRGTLNPGYYMMFWDTAVGGGAGGTGHYDGGFNLTFAAVPEPASFAMVLAALPLLPMLRRRYVGGYTK